MYYSEQFRAKNTPLSSNVELSVFLLICFGSDFWHQNRGSISRTARQTVFLGSLTDHKAAWLLHLHKKKGMGEGFNQQLNHLFVSQQSFVVLLSRPAQSVILSFVCCLVSLRFPPLVLNPGWVSLFHNILFLLIIPGVKMQRCTDNSQEVFWSLFSRD